MGKDKNTQSSSKSGLTKFCAFWALAIASVMYLFNGIIQLIIKFVGSISSKVAGVLSEAGSVILLLGNIALILAIALPAYSYVRGKKKGWKIFYWVALAIFVLGVVFGIIAG